jgi:hypothetical protein
MAHRPLTGEPNMKTTTGVILLPVMAKLVPPRTPEEVQETIKVADAIRGMTGLDEIELDMRYPDSPPWVRLRYRGGGRPKEFWNRWLWIRVCVAHRLELAWICRLAEINPRRRQLFLIPRPAALDVSAARQSIEGGTTPCITSIKLGVLHPPAQIFRTLPFFH